MKLVLGTMTFGESVFAPNVDEFVEMFLDAGYEELDTAYVYNEGNCEKLLGEVLPKLRSPYKISTKVNPRITGKLDGEAAYIQLNESLKSQRKTPESWLVKPVFGGFALCGKAKPLHPARKLRQQNAAAYCYKKLT